MMRFLQRMTGPHNFCSWCGKPMTDVEITRQEGFDQTTGEPIHKTKSVRVCGRVVGNVNDNYDLHDGQDEYWKAGGQ